MKTLLTVGLCLVSSLATADCYVRSTTNITPSALQSAPVDFQKISTPDPKGHKCVIRYRAYLNDQWNSIEGIGIDKDPDVACARAMDLKRGVVLEEIVREKVKSDQQMVCSDLPDIRVRSVQVGELIWESETDLHRNPRERAYFVYKQTKCRMFTERASKDSNLQTYQGIICQADTGPNPKWRVIDKY
jgi:hypothetical protein